MQRIAKFFRRTPAPVGASAASATAEPTPPAAGSFRPRDAPPSRRTLLHAPPAVTDHYAWLEDRECAGVRRYMRAENAYAERVIAQKLRPMQRALRAEIDALHRTMMPQARRTPAERVGEYEYFSEIGGGNSAAAADDSASASSAATTDLPQLWRRRVAAATTSTPNARGSRSNHPSTVECVLDPADVQRRWGAHSDFFTIAQQKLSLDQRFVAFTFDTSGAERHEARVRDLHTRRYLADFEGVAGIGSVEWCSAPGLPPAMIYTGACVWACGRGGDSATRAPSVSFSKFHFQAQFLSLRILFLFKNRIVCVPQ